MSKYNRTIFFMMLLLIYLCTAPFLISIFLYTFQIEFENEAIMSVSMLFLTPLICSLCPAILYFLTTKENIKAELKINKLSIKNFFLIVLMSFLIQPVANFIALITTLFFPNTASNVMGSITSIPFLLFLLVSAIMPAIFEEMMFRGIILSGCRSTGIIKSSLISGLFFAIMHLDPHQTVYAFLIGTIFALFVTYTNSIFSSILSHFIINATQGALIYISNIIFETFPDIESSTENYAPQIFDFIFFGAMAIISGTLFVLVFSHFIKSNKTKVVAPTDKPPKKIITVPFAITLILFFAYIIFLQLSGIN